MERFTGKVDAILTAFEPDGAASAEDQEARLEAARGWLEGFVRRVAERRGLVHPRAREVPLPGGRLVAGG